MLISNTARRSSGPPNKRSVALDLKDAGGRRDRAQLIATADVVVENFSTGVMERFGLDYESCRKIRPEIVYCSVSAYGRDGTFADSARFRSIAQVETGCVHERLCRPRGVRACRR